MVCGVGVVGVVVVGGAVVVVGSGGLVGNLFMQVVV